MKEKKGNLILFLILAILMIIAISIVIINPTKTQTKKANLEKKEDNIIQDQEENNIEQVTQQEEKEASMQSGGEFCKIGNQIIFYEDTNKTIYRYSEDDNKTNKIATLEDGANKIYFDGEYIYAIPYYYMGKGIYKIDLQGNVQKIYEGASLQLWITENEIYFVKQIGFDDLNQNPQGTICVMDKDGNNIVEVAQNIKNNFFIQNDKIYYTTQDRKMYEINRDGTNPVNLLQGRKFVIDVNDEYLLYIDYGNQEEKHILNLETNEDSVIANFGILKKCQGRTYLNARKRLDDGSIENEYTLFEIKKNGTITEIGKISDFGTNIKYITNEKAYVYNQEEGIYTINLENNQKEDAENYDGCRFFLGGYGYKIHDSDLEDIKIEKIEL